MIPSFTVDHGKRCAQGKVSLNNPEGFCSSADVPITLLVERICHVVSDVAAVPFRNMSWELTPESNKYREAGKVCDTGERNLQMMADIVSQKIVCFIDTKRH